METGHDHVTRSCRPSDARKGQAALALVPDSRRSDDSSWNSGIGLSTGVVTHRGRSLGLCLDCQRHRARHQSHRRARPTLFLAAASLGRPLGAYRGAFDSSSWCGPSRAHASAACVLDGRGHREGEFFAGNKAISELGLGPSERHPYDTGSFLSLGQLSCNRGLAAWRVAGRPADLRRGRSRLFGVAGTYDLRSFSCLNFASRSTRTLQMERNSTQKYYLLSDLHMGGDGALQHCDYIDEYFVEADGRAAPSR